MVAPLTPPPVTSPSPSSPPSPAADSIQGCICVLHVLSLRSPHRAPLQCPTPFNAPNPSCPP